MAIAFPTFENTFCQMVGVCSHLKEGAPVRTLPTGDVEIVSGYKVPSGRALARMVWNPGSQHLHLDVALPTAFGKNPPSPDTPIAKFRKTLASFEGLVATSIPHSSYSLPISSLPTTGGLIFVGNSAIKLSTGKAEIELTGATLTFRGSEIRRIRWSLLRDKVWLDVSSTRRELALDNTYITEVLRRFDSAVATYILGKKANGTSGA